MLKAAHIPNTICLLRIALVAPTVMVLMDGRYALTLGLVFVAGFSDALDGYLAKRFEWRSRLGGILDPLADKLLLISLFLAMAALGLIPVWLAGVVIGRDMVIVSGALAYTLLIGPVQPEPMGASKINTLAQLVCIVVVLLEQIAGAAPPGLVLLAGAAVMVTSVVSGLGYVIRWSGKALQARQ